MTDTTLAKGVLFGICYTSGCDISGTSVHGIAGQANMWGGDANYTHRCESCHELIRQILENLLIMVQREEHLSEMEATSHKTFISVGRQILSMDLDQLKGAKI